jgi:flagellar protein FlaG
MVGNSTSVTAVPAAKPAPSTAALVGVSRRVVPAGNHASETGEFLPPEAPVAPAADVAETVRRLNELMAQSQRNLRFHVDEASGRTVITVRNATTDAVVRQIPAEEVLVMARAVEQTGALVDTHV